MSFTNETYRTLYESYMEGVALYDSLIDWEINWRGEECAEVVCLKELRQRVFDMAELVYDQMYNE